MNTSFDHFPDSLLSRQHAANNNRIAQQLHLRHSTTGFAALDELLPGGGWPLSALTEIHHARTSIGELRLLMPTLARLSRQGRWITIIAPPYIPYAAALAAFGMDLSRVLLVHPRSQQDGLAALERGLRSGTCGAVIAWPKQVDSQIIQRLQAAAKAGKTWGILFCDPTHQAMPSPAALRLCLTEDAGKTNIQLLDKTGACSSQTLTLDLSRHPDLLPGPLLETEISMAAQRSASTSSRRQTSLPAARSPHRRNRQQERPPQLELPLPLPPNSQAPVGTADPALHG